MSRTKAEYRSPGPGQCDPVWATSVAAAGTPVAARPRPAPHGRVRTQAERSARIASSALSELPDHFDRARFLRTVSQRVETVQSRESSPPPLEGLGREGDQVWREGWEPPGGACSPPSPVRPHPDAQGGTPGHLPPASGAQVAR